MRPLHLFFLWIAVVAGLVAIPACYGHTCEGDVVVFGKQPGEGHLVSPDVWETTSIDEGWLEFPHQRTWDIYLDALGFDRLPVVILPSVSAQANPLAEGGNFTVSAGNLTTLQANRGHITVHNDTCADYYLRVVVSAAPIATPLAGDGGAGDASTEGTPTIAP